MYLFVCKKAPRPPFEHHLPVQEAAISPRHIVFISKNQRTKFDHSSIFRFSVEVSLLLLTIFNLFATGGRFCMYLAGVLG